LLVFAAVEDENKSITFLKQELINHTSGICTAARNRGCLFCFSH
jgi:hypothetical protein